MNVLITGATGFIGSHLADHLHAKGYTLRALVRASSSNRYIKHLPVDYVTADFNDPDSLRDAVSGVDYIYHVAGLTAARDREEFFRGNQIATRNLLDATLKHNPDIRRFVHVSTQAVVGPAPSADAALDERSPLRPLTAYAASKAAAEQEATSRMGTMPITIVRPPAVYGPRDPEIFRFFSTVAKGFAPLIGFNRKLVSLVHVEDLVRGFIQAGESPRAEGETYFISSEKFYSWEEVGAITATVFGHKRPRHLRIPHPVIFVAGGFSGFFSRFQKKPSVFNFEKARDITQGYWLCRVDKAMEHFGYRQLVSIGDGVAGTIAWYREQGWLK
jgi:dihydroflavonol-4-reductase